jgi:hypothetical protein
MKHFFVVLYHPPSLQKALVAGVLKKTPQTQAIFEESRNTYFLQKEHLLTLGLKIPAQKDSYLVPIQISRDWFIH